MATSSSPPGRSRWVATWWQTVLLVPLLAVCAALALPLAAVALVSWGAYAAVVVIGVSIWWIPRGRRFLVVYSDSELWQSYFRDEVAPAFGASARVINHSRDGGTCRWWDLGWAAYRLCGGARNHLPIVVRFSAFGPWKSIRFYRAYKLAKGGEPADLERAKQALHAWKPKAG